MSARDVIVYTIAGMTESGQHTNGEGADAILAALHAMPPADRLALARALVAPEGLSVGKVPIEADEDNEDEAEWSLGFNACRAAFLASTGGDDEQG